MSYPRTLYMLVPDSTASISTVVQSMEEHTNALADGWHDDPACGAEPAPEPVAAQTPAGEADPSTDPDAPAGGDSGDDGEGS